MAKNPQSRANEYDKEYQQDYEVCSVAANKAIQKGLNLSRDWKMGNRWLTQHTKTLMLVGSRPNIVFKQSQLYKLMMTTWSAKKKEEHKTQHLNGASDWHCVGVLLHQNVVSLIPLPDHWNASTNMNQLYIYDSGYPNQDPA